MIAPIRICFCLTTDSDRRIEKISGIKLTEETETFLLFEPYNAMSGMKTVDYAFVLGLGADIANAL